MIQVEKVSKQYQKKYSTVKALDKINLQVEKGAFVVIRGPSGSGKTTLLLTIGGMLRPTSGRVTIDGNDLYELNERKRAKFRAENIGFVFQMFHLLTYLNTRENILLPASVRKRRLGKTEVMELIERLKLKERASHKPPELSVGERQRTAIARALLNQPKLILADEPTGNLDPENAADAMEYLSEFHCNGGTVVVVTHGEVANQYADRIIYLKDGRIEKM